MESQLQSERSKSMVKKRAKRKQRKTPNRYKPLISKMQSKGLFDEYEVRYEPDGVAKMSEVVLDFIEPYVKYAKTDEAYKKLIVVAIFAWNAALLPERERRTTVKKMVKKLPLSRSEARDMRGTVEELVERKSKHFAEYDRFILDYQLTETRNGFHLSVASTLSEP
jgi:hypothetical protein